jgi:hypothetical protein
VIFSTIDVAAAAGEAEHDVHQDSLLLVLSSSISPGGVEVKPLRPGDALLTFVKNSCIMILS